MPTSHAHCTHPATKAARALCRKAGGNVELLAAVALTEAARCAVDSAPCADCLNHAMDSAHENLLDRGEPTTYEHLVVEARHYLYDRGALSCCPAHEHLM